MTSTSLPVLTVGNSKRFFSGRDYRSECAEQVAEIIFDLKKYRGVSRRYLP
jgi:hypothetical protein